MYFWLLLPSLFYYTKSSEGSRINPKLPEHVCLVHQVTMAEIPEFSIFKTKALNRFKSKSKINLSLLPQTGGGKKSRAVSKAEQILCICNNDAWPALPDSANLWFRTLLVNSSLVIAPSSISNT